MYLQGACKVCVCVRYLCMHVFMYVFKVCVRARVWIRCICMCVSCVCVRVCVEGVYVCWRWGEGMGHVYDNRPCDFGFIVCVCERFKSMLASGQKM